MKAQTTHPISYSSVEQMPNAKGSALFLTDSSKVFKDDIDIAPVTLPDGTQYMPWGGDNLMPYHILEMIEKDETLSTCQMFNAEVCYGSGLNYNSVNCDTSAKEEIEDFLLANSLLSYLKYHIEVSYRYWEGIFKRERITDPRKQQDRIVKEKQQIIDFLTGAENSGKALFSTFYITPNGEEQHDVRISRIDDTKEGGDWSTDIQEAVNMVCFTMRVHSNLVGSVPGKAQTNNSGSDAFDTLYIGAEKFPQTETSFVSVSGVS